MKPQSEWGPADMVVMILIWVFSAFGMAMMVLMAFGWIYYWVTGAYPRIL